MTKVSPKLVGVLKVLMECALSEGTKTRRKLFESTLFNLLSLLSAVLLPILLRSSIDSYSPIETDPNKNYFLWFLVFYLCIWLSNRVFLFLREVNILPVMESIVYALSIKLFKHIMTLPFEFHTRKKTGQLTAAVESINNSAPVVVLSLVFSIAPLILQTLFSLISILYFCGPIYAFIMASSLFLFLLFANLNFLKLFRLFRKASIARAITSSKIVDSFLNFTTIKYFYSYQFEFRKAEHYYKFQETKQQTAYVKAETTRFHQTFLVSTLVGSLILFSGYKTYEGLLSLGSFMMINYYVFYFMTQMESFGQVFQRFLQSLIQMEKGLKNLNYKAENFTGTLKLNPSDSLHIVFEDVWFGYTKDRPILKGVSFELNPKQMISIIGETGSGKSTIISLLLQFHTPWSGRILINGHDLRTIDHESLLDKIGIVPQDICLFNETIFTNLYYANPTASANDLRRAIANAQLTNTISSFPLGMETIIGERGVQLSGGEKQRLSIARALLREPKLYIFDEGTSALDHKTEKKILATLKEISKNCGVLFITHRESTLASSDHVVNLSGEKMAA